MKIACFHIADFPAWVQQQLVPEQQYVAVHADGKIIARSRELSHAGLGLGESLDRAREQYPYASFHLSDTRLEQAIWEDVQHLLGDVASNMLPLQPGWALLQGYDEEGLRSLCRSLAARLGIAPRRFVAMMAAVQAGVGEMRRVEAWEMKTFANRSPVRHLLTLGFDREFIEQLELLGYFTIGRLARLTRWHLRDQFGAQGVSLFDLIHPEEEEAAIPLFQPPPTITVSYSFEHPLPSDDEIAATLGHLVELGHRELGGRRAQLLMLRLGGEEAEEWNVLRRVLKVPTAGIEHFRAAARFFIEQILAAKEQLDTVTLQFGALVQSHQVAQVAEQPAVYAALKSVPQQFPGALLRAVITDPAAYLPERGERLNPHPVVPPRRRSGIL